MRPRRQSHEPATRSTVVVALRVILAAFVVGAAAAGGCDGDVGDERAGSANSTPASASASPGAVPVAGRTTDEGVQLVSDALIDALEGRIAAMNRGDGWAAAAFYTPDGALEETDMTPHYVTKGREWLADRFSELYDSGLRLAPAGAPTASGRYVAEPTRFYHGSGPGRGAGMLVFEVDDDGLLAHQWMIGWAGGPEETFAIVKSPSVHEPNLPPRKVKRIIGDCMAALGRGDVRASVADVAPRAVLEVSDPDTGLLARLRGEVESRLKELCEGGLRVEPATAPIAYDVYVAQPVRFSRADGESASAGMVVVEFDSAYRIVHAWIIGGAGSA